MSGLMGMGMMQSLNGVTVFSVLEVVEQQLHRGRINSGNAGTSLLETNLN